MNLKRPKNSAELEAAIAYHEWQQASAKAELSTLGQRSVRAAHPIRILHDVVADAIEDPDLQRSFYDTLSQSTGALARKVIVRNSDNEWLNLAGDIAQKSISTWLALELQRATFEQQGETTT